MTESSRFNVTFPGGQQHHIEADYFQVDEGILYLKESPGTPVAAYPVNAIVAVEKEVLSVSGSTIKAEAVTCGCR